MASGFSLMARHRMIASALHEETATGNPLNIISGAWKVEEAIVSFLPKQDLNGYSNPWGPGLGKNLVGTAIVTYGKSISTSGAVVSYSTNRCATENPLIIDNTKSYVFSTTSNDVYCIYAVFNGSTLLRRTAGVASGTVLNVTGGDQLYLCFYSYDPTLQSGQYDYRKVLLEDDEIQVEEASAPTSYEPYSNVCAIMGKTSIGIKRTTRSFVDDSIRRTTSTTVVIGQTVPSTTQTIELKAGTYTFSALYKNGASSAGYMRKQGDTANTRLWNVGDDHATFTLTADTYCSFWLYNANGIIPSDVFAQVEAGSIAHDILTVTFDFPTSAGTVYGGVLHVDTGVLEVTHIKVPVSDSTKRPDVSNGWVTGLNANRIGFAVSPDLFPRRTDTIDIVCNIGFASSAAQGSSDNFITGACALYRGQACMYFRFCVPKSITGSAAAFEYLKDQGCEFTAPLGSPLTFSLTPYQIELLLGYNTITTDGDEVEVTYWEP